jgi:hypothetical protein
MFEDDKGVIRCYPRRTDNTIAKRKKKRQTVVDKPLHIEINIV